MMIRRKDAAYIRTDAVAEIASDGLMGNKLVNIIPGDGSGGPLADGNVLNSAPGLDTDAMLRTLGTSNDNLMAITNDLRELAGRLNSEQGLLTFLTDTALVMDVRAVVMDVRGAAANANQIAQRTNAVVRDLQAGKGALGALVSDPAAEEQVRTILANLQHVSDSLMVVTRELGPSPEALPPKGGLVTR
ncbi:MAG: hypothetical protein IPG92_14600 [Flavobacteriales bacterium]|nr:hypothetical protein [Flavobacteriales bacterium]